MSTIDPDYRPNIDRSVCVFGEINESLVNHLAPEILKLRSEGDRPITVFINSTGGSIRSLNSIRSLLTTKGPRGKEARIITVAIGNAGSAAATLLSLGDYAIAYPRAAIYFHGIRYGSVEDVTMESASSMFAQLERQNKQMAYSLARAGTKRLAFHYARLKDRFQKIRATAGGETLTDIECFARCLYQKLSADSDHIVNSAIQKWKYLSKLNQRIVHKVASTGKKGLRFESDILRRLITFEATKHKNETSWGLDEEGVIELVSDYLMLRDFDVGAHRNLANSILQLYGGAFFEPKQLEVILRPLKPGESPSEETMRLIRDAVSPFCYFAASIWQALQKDENPLPPVDAYWLGAVDELYDTTLPCKRQVAENDEPNQPPLAPSASTEQQPPSAQSQPSGQ